MKTRTYKKVTIFNPKTGMIGFDLDIKINDGAEVVANILYQFCAEGSVVEPIFWDLKTNEEMRAEIFNQVNKECSEAARDMFAQYMFNVGGFGN